MTPEQRPQLPIGYWLKHADETITKHVNEVLNDHGLTRFHWQLLHFVHESDSATKAQAFAPMQTFVDTNGFEALIRDFEARGWMTQHAHGTNGETGLALTEQGTTGHRAIFALQRAIRQRAMQGISEDDYAIVIRVLQQIVANLE